LSGVVRIAQQHVVDRVRQVLGWHIGLGGADGDHGGDGRQANNERGDGSEPGSASESGKCGHERLLERTHTEERRGRIPVSTNLAESNLNAVSTRCRDHGIVPVARSMRPSGRTILHICLVTDGAAASAVPAVLALQS
jgi:hypothetical protein